MESIKIPETDIELRIDYPPEEIEMFAHSGECRYCNGIVKMIRDTNTGKLRLDNCWCLLCGQRYYVKIEGSIEEWELNQWEQKAEKERVRKER